MECSDDDGRSDTARSGGPACMPPPLPSRGARLRIWWDGDKEWFAGEAARVSADGARHTVQYDDGDEHEEDLRKERWELLLPRAGDRLRIWWPDDKKWFSGVVERVREGAAASHTVLYDDGERHDEQLQRERRARRREEGEGKGESAHM